MTLSQVKNKKYTLSFPVTMPDSEEVKSLVFKLKNSGYRPITIRDTNGAVINLTEGVNEKDWMRMSDLVSAGKDGTDVANKITDKNKAISRFVAGVKLSGGNNLDYNNSWERYQGSYSDFGNRA